MGITTMSMCTKWASLYNVQWARRALHTYICSQCPFDIIKWCQMDITILCYNVQCSMGMVAIAHLYMSNMYTVNIIKWCPMDSILFNVQRQWACWALPAHELGRKWPLGRHTTQAARAAEAKIWREIYSDEIFAIKRHWLHLYWIHCTRKHCQCTMQ